MNADEMIQRARQMTNDDLDRMSEPEFVKTIAWLHYLGLLRHNKIAPKRENVALQDALTAAKLEPRILELLPAILIALPKALGHEPKDVPNDLANVLNAIRKGIDPPIFRGIPAPKYLHWLNAHAMKVAQRKIDLRHMPRKSKDRKNSIAEVIKQGRIKLALTQRQFSDQFGVSLRVLRDLEQGKMNASVRSVNEILEIFGRQLRA